MDYTLLQVPGGYAVERFGLTWPYTAAFLLWSLMAAACYLVLVRGSAGSVLRAALGSDPTKEATA